MKVIFQVISNVMKVMPKSWTLGKLVIAIALKVTLLRILYILFFLFFQVCAYELVQ